MSENPKYCAKCKKKYEENDFRPFCSKRCQLLDFSDWVTESYRVPTEEAPKSDDSDA